MAGLLDGVKIIGFEQVVGVPASTAVLADWGADIINMSTCPEVILANELGLPYQTIAMSTDYDCWKEDEAPVTFEMVMKTMGQNAEKVKKLLVAAIPRIK